MSQGEKVKNKIKNQLLTLSPAVQCRILTEQAVIGVLLSLIWNGTQAAVARQLNSYEDRWK